MVLLAVGEELAAEVGGVVCDVGQDDDGRVSGAVPSRSAVASLARSPVVETAAAPGA